MRGKDRAHKGPLVAQHAPAVVPDLVCLDEVRVCAKQLAVLLIGGEAGPKGWKTVPRQAGKLACGAAVRPGQRAGLNLLLVTDERPDA